MKRFKSPLLDEQSEPNTMKNLKSTLNPILRLNSENNQGVPSSAPDALSFEHFLPWIHKIMLAYQGSDNSNAEQMLPQGTSFSKGYYSKKMN